MFPEDIQTLAAEVIDAAVRKGVRVATAESCTGGLVAAALTAVPGSSAVLDRGFVTYSNAAKASMIGVDAAVIAADGAVSEGVARAMAEGAVAHSDADLAVSITGVAGPGGGSVEKPVGLVHFAAHDAAGTVHRVERFSDLGRDQVRLASVRVALGLLLQKVGG
ncbi:CinA family protein [Brevundimonas sp. VNH65]|uniref:CinA family protein n=1 Tax=Brevundimonas sp. VNH65 TaxID=3400917 RepID=UPI003C0E1A06